MSRNYRVFNIARDLGLTSQEIIERLKRLGIDVKTASSQIDEDTADKLKRALKIDALTTRKKRIYGSEEDEAERDERERAHQAWIEAEREKAAAAAKAAAEVRKAAAAAARAAEGKKAAATGGSGAQQVEGEPNELPPALLHAPGAPRLPSRSPLVAPVHPVPPHEIPRPPITGVRPAPNGTTESQPTHVLDKKPITEVPPKQIAASAEALAFWSYVHKDDEYSEGQISDLQVLLVRAVEALTGKPFYIFQDRQSIAWGQAWRERIEQAIRGTTFFIAVITPRFFQSKACRDELEMFLARERQLGRDDLVLPIYFIDCEELEDRATRDGDHLAQAIAKHQYVDWRKLRHAHPKAVRKRVDELAGSIRKALKRSATRTSPS